MMRKKVYSDILPQFGVKSLYWLLGLSVLKNTAVDATPIFSSSLFTQREMDFHATLYLL